MQSDSASLGAAYRAAHGWAVAQAASAGRGFVTYEAVLTQGPEAAASGVAVAPGDGVRGGAGPVELRKAAEPNAAAHAAISAATGGYRAAEAAVLAE